MAFGFGPLPGMPQSMTMEDIAKLLSASPVSSQVAAQGNPLSFLERRRALNGAEDGAAQAGLFGGNAMGAPQAFGFGPLPSGGGNVVAEQGQPHGEAQTAADLQAVMSPKVAEGSPARVEDDPRPMQATLRMPRPLGFGALPVPPALEAATDRGAPVAADFQPAPPVAGPVHATDAASAAEADLPGKTAVPMMGKASPAMPAVPVSPAAAAPAPTPDGGFDFGAALQRFNAKGGSDFLTNVGTGLMTTRGFFNGVGAGLQANQKQEATRATADLARAEFGLKARKLGQADAGLNLTRSQLIAKGNAPADVDTAIAASQAGHNDPLNNLLNRIYPKAAEAPAGFTLNPDGSMRRIVGGPQDPNVKREDAQATAEGSNAGKPDDSFNLSAGQTRYSADGKPIVTAPEKKPEGFDAEAKLRTEFNKNLGTFQDVHDGYGRVLAATEQRSANPKAVSPAADIGLVFGYMKMLDPGSVVREGEYATAANAAGMPERVRNAYNKALSGEFLSPEQRQDFIENAERLYGKARGTAEGVAGRYRGLADQYGVDPGRSVYLPEPYKPLSVGPSRTVIPGASTPLDIGGSRDAGSGITIKRVR